MSDYPKIEVPKNCCDGKKNEDAKKIKELLDDGRFDCCTNQYPVSRDSVKEVWAIAERMAEEIEAANDLKNYWNNAYNDLIKENDALKSELEKRPDVVRCGECESWNPIEPLENNYSLIKPQGPCMIRKDNTYFYEDDFCSRGQRKSEVGK